MYYQILVLKLLTFLKVLQEYDRLIALYAKLTLSINKNISITLFYTFQEKLFNKYACTIKKIYSYRWKNRFMHRFY